MGTSRPGLDALRKAIEGRDATALKSFYAPEAEITVIDSMNPPSMPRIIRGAADIGAYLDEVCGRDMTHVLESAVLQGDRLAFLQRCAYAGGTRVAASSTADLGPAGIVRQTTVQAWDG
jgi:hypothetical protein